VKRERILRWQDAAVRDLEEAHACLSKHNPEAARRFAVQILEAVEMLRSFPELGPVAYDLRPHDRYRSLSCGSHRIIYRIDSEVIWLLRVWDSRQDPRSLKPEEG
jgi:plasmid stabilization system protein ParE